MLSLRCFVTKLAPYNGLDGARLLFDLKRCGELVSGFAGCLDAVAIASVATEGIVNQFGCAFARIWLVEPDRSASRLVASSGLYTRLNGSFARVPMGHFKVGKIAQNCIPFLSNALPDEAWVKDRNWAIENGIRGFAGLPLVADRQAIGVLAVFSHRALTAEFLEVLQLLSTSVAGALSSALQHDEVVRSIRHTEDRKDSILDKAGNSPLSDREQEVIELLAQGLRDREIAEQLFISERTVKFHAKNMLFKLQVKTRVQAVFEAAQQGWLT